MPQYESEEKLLKFLNTLDDEGASARGDLDRRMTDNLDQFRGKQWKSSKPPYFLFNIIEASLEDKGGRLSETKPTINVMPTKNGLKDAAECLTKTVESIWHRRRMEFKTERIALYGAIAGAAFVGTPFNRRLANGIGDIDLVIKDPRACKIDISVTAAEDADLGEYAIFEDFVPLDVVRSEYPERGDEVKPDEKISGYDKSISTPTAQTLIRGTFSRIFKKHAPDQKSAIPKTILKEYYVQDRRKSLDDKGVVPMVDGLTEPADDGGVPFPGGRRIVRAGDVILEDSFNPYWDGAYPIDMLSWKQDIETAWAADEIQSVKRIQEAINRLGDAYTRTAILNSVVRLIADTGALSPTERNKLSNEVGQIIEKNPGRSLEFVVPPLLSADVIKFVDQLMGWARQKLGVQEIPTEKQVPSIITGPAIEGLQMMVETPIRTAARRVEEFYMRIGQKLISRIFQYYTSDRVIHLVGPDQRWMQFEFQRMQLIRDAKGKPRSNEDIRKAYRDFYFTIDPLSSLPVTRTQRALMLFQLAQAGWMHPAKVLEALGIQNPEEEIKKAMEAKEGGLFESVMKGAGANAAKSLAA
jgi:hypothetical protein